MGVEWGRTDFIRMVLERGIRGSLRAVADEYPPQGETGKMTRGPRPGSAPT